MQRRTNVRVCRLTVCLLSARDGDDGVLTDEQTGCLACLSATVFALVLFKLSSLAMELSQ